MFGAAHEEVATYRCFDPLSRATANTLMNLDQTAANADGIDCLGFDEALITIYAGAVAAGASLQYTIKSAPRTAADAAPKGNDAGVANVVDASANIARATIADTEDSTIEQIRVRCQDIGRYLFVERIQTGAFAAVESVTVQLMKNRSGRPVTQPTGTTVTYTHPN